jgi:hypothetical protein
LVLVDDLGVHGHVLGRQLWQLIRLCVHPKKPI